MILSLLRRNRSFTIIASIALSILSTGEQLPSDTDEDNKYTRSAHLEQWLDKESLRQTECQPSIFISTVLVITAQGIDAVASSLRSGWRNGTGKIIRPHENTRGKPKDDRLNLLWALQANTSPVFAMFEDQGQQIASLLAEKEQGRPIINLISSEEEHRIWAITSPEVISQISTSLSDRPLYIADGHHRYESALNYRKERLTCSPSASGNED